MMIEFALQFFEQKILACLYDPSGNVSQRLEIYDASAYVGARDYQNFDAYGALTGRADTISYPQVPRDLDPVGFGGQYGYYTDQETGLVLLGARYYDPSTGRFLNRDPIGYGGGINLYGFCGNNPVNESDPEGTSDDASPLHTLITGVGNAVEGTVQVAESANSLVEATAKTAEAGADFAAAGADIAAVAAEGIPALAKTAAHTVVTLAHQKVLEYLSSLPSSQNFQSHHIIQSKAVEHLPGYKYFEAPAVPMQGPAYDKSTDHGITRFIQRQRGGGNFLAEVRIGYKALRRAGYDMDEARGHMRNAIQHFASIGVYATTPTNIPRDRR